MEVCFHKRLSGPMSFPGEIRVSLVPGPFGGGGRVYPGVGCHGGRYLEG